jgi:hypothetical protein
MAIIAGVAVNMREIPGAKFMIESHSISTLASRLEMAALADPESFEVQQLRERVKRADTLVATLSADLKVARQALAEGDRAYSALKLKFVVAHQDAAAWRRKAEARQTSTAVTISKSERRLIASCLHPDPHPQELKEKFEKAFIAFQSLCG